MTEYWCHQCERIVNATSPSPFAGTLQCQQCGSEFIEAMSPPSSSRQLAPSTTSHQHNVESASNTRPQYFDTLMSDNTTNNAQQQPQQDQNNSPHQQQQQRTSATPHSISISFTTYNMPLHQANINGGNTAADPFTQLLSGIFHGFVPTAQPQRQQSASENSNNTANATATAASNDASAQPQTSAQQPNIPPFLQMINSMFNMPATQQTASNGVVQFYTVTDANQPFPAIFQQMMMGLPIMMSMGGQMGYRRDYHPPAAQKVIDELVNVTVTDDHVERNIECAVCLEALKLNENVKQMPCHGKHLFHEQCLVPWLQQKCTCPSCRFEVESNDPDWELWKRQQQQQQHSNTTNVTTTAPSQPPTQ